MVCLNQPCPRRNVVGIINSQLVNIRAKQSLLLFLFSQHCYYVQVFSFCYFYPLQIMKPINFISSKAMFNNLLLLFIFYYLTIKIFIFFSSLYLKIVTVFCLVSIFSASNYYLKSLTSVWLKCLHLVQCRPRCW